MKQGKVLSYVPPSSKEGKVYVSIEQEDLIEQAEYRKSAIIGYIIGDTPYMKTMEKFVVHNWKNEKINPDLVT